MPGRSSRHQICVETQIWKESWNLGITANSSRKLGELPKILFDRFLLAAQDGQAHQQYDDHVGEGQRMLIAVQHTRCGHPETGVHLKERRGNEQD